VSEPVPTEPESGKKIYPGGRPVSKLTYVFVFSVMLFILAVWVCLVMIGFVLWLPLDLFQVGIVFIALMGVFVLMIAGWIVEHLYGTFILSFYTWVTYVMMGAFVYGLLASLVLVLLYIPIRTLGMTTFIDTWGYTVCICGVMIIVGVIAVGMINARRFRITRLKVYSTRLKKKHIRLVMVSDIHASGAFAKCQLDEINAMVSKQKPDILLAVGDLIEMHPQFLQHSRALFEELFGKQPTYAVTGNHEYINNPTDTVAFLEECGARFIRDDVYLDEKFGIMFAGLEDPTGNFFYGKRREAMEKVMASLQGNEYPVVVLEHQPQNFDVAAENGVELMLCGHTHAGQLWPFGYAVKKNYGDIWRGKVVVGDSTCYTGDGSGTWGPPMRIGSINEIVVVDLIRKD